VPAAELPKLPVLADTKGRLRVTKAQRRDILAALARSGESVPGFARRTGLRYSTLASWVKHSRRPQRPVRSPQLKLLEAVMESAPVTATGSLLVLQLPGGVRVEVADEKQALLAAALVRALAKPC
jgi:transposase-like protein